MSITSLGHNVRVAVNSELTASGICAEASRTGLLDEAFAIGSGSAAICGFVSAQPHMLKHINTHTPIKLFFKIIIALASLESATSGKTGGLRKMERPKAA